MKNLQILFCILVLGSVCSCASPTTYLQADREVGYGYFETPLDTNAYIVSFHGNALTSSTISDRYTLYRAAELTKSKGYDYFKVADNKSSANDISYTETNTFTGKVSGGGATEFTSVRTIRLYHGQPPADDPTTYNADRLLQTLAPYIQR